jgi:hypothetical protein
VVRVPASSLSFLSNSAGPSLLRPHRTPPSSVRAAPQLPPSAFHQGQGSQGEVKPEEGSAPSASGGTARGRRKGAEGEPSASETDVGL